MTLAPRAWLMSELSEDDSANWCEPGPDEPEPEPGFVAVPLFDQEDTDLAVAAGREWCAAICDLVWATTSGPAAKRCADEIRNGAP